MARRTTLGPITSSALNSRGPGPGWNSALKSRRASAAPATLLGSGRRSSTAPSVRRSSTFAGTGGVGIANDPRPLSDKSYRDASGQNLICYLLEHSFDCEVSPKVLSKPTAKDFRNILLFLLRQIDPSFSFQNRLEDDVRAVFKHLKYPFQISKSALHAVGSPHTWPALLGTLIWLHELLQYDEAAELKREEHKQLDSEAEAQRIFFDYLQKTYESFLSGDDNFDELDEELEKHFDVKNLQVEEDLEALEEELASLQAQVEKIKHTESPLGALDARQKDLSDNVVKFKSLIEELVHYRSQMQQRVEENEKQVAFSETELQQKSTEKERLRELVAQQESDAVDVQRIERDRSTLRSALERLQEQRSNAEKMQKDADASVVHATERVEAVLGRYHELADALKLIPASAENANGVEFKALLTRNASITRAEDLLSVDLNGVVRAALLDLKEALEKSVLEAQEEALSLEETKSILGESLMLKSDAIRHQEARLAKLEDKYASEKEGMVEHLRSIADNSLQLEEEVARVKSESDDLLRASQKRLTTASAELRALRDRLAQLRAEATGNMLDSLDRLTSHKAHVQESLAALATHMNTTWSGI